MIDDFEFVGRKGSVVLLEPPQSSDGYQIEENVVYILTFDFVDESLPDSFESVRSQCLSLGPSWRTSPQQWSKRSFDESVDAEPRICTLRRINFFPPHSSNGESTSADQSTRQRIDAQYGPGCFPQPARTRPSSSTSSTISPLSDRFIDIRSRSFPRQGSEVTFVDGTLTCCSHTVDVAREKLAASLWCHPR